jgi:hypothetical protein
MSLYLPSKITLDSNHALDAAELERAGLQILWFYGYEFIGSPAHPRFTLPPDYWHIRVSNVKPGRSRTNKNYGMATAPRNAVGRDHHLPGIQRPTDRSEPG